ncbi:Retrovirus-related Pol polyprotein from transposon 297 [Vitis vinifera]|uniref:Retrovirus-related Pol polyprotein from transposon 297 n=1 Tax=Vitis vinifera TaxID=29760 RepID=A0A438FDT8_VITVI|nr:Retrovirus-related Pol polyprotein from transposon 297 [Vitis vinifera]
MEATPEDQHSHQGSSRQFNEFRSMRDRMHPPRMSAPSCIVPPTEQLVIRPYLVPLLPTLHGMETTPRDNVWRRFHEQKSEEAMDFLSYVVKVSRGWDEPTKGEVGKDESQLSAFNAKLGLQAVAEAPVQPNNNAPYGNTYNSSWRNHPNSHGRPEQLSTKADQPSQQSSSLEQAIANLSKVVGDFVGNQEAINAQLNQRIDRAHKFEHSTRKGKFPSQPHQNPKGVHEVEVKREIITYERCQSLDHSKEWEKALLDLGASVNLLPYSVYKQLGLGELKPTGNHSISRDRSVKIPRGVLKLLQAGIIYPISDSPWVSPTQVVPKKSGITVVQNEKGEEITTRLTSVLERVSGHPFYCFLDGYSMYFQIEIDVEDQEKTTFTCPFGTYAYRRMPFGLCNAPATFQRCMLSIFSDMVERIMEVFMDDITVYGGTFEECLINLEAVLHRCIEKDLVLNWEKCILCDFAIGAVLGQREDGKPYVIYYASKTLNEAQRNYTTTEKDC